MHNDRVKAPWPISLSNTGRCDTDTRELESARNRALAQLTEMLKPDDPLSSIIAVSGSHQSSALDTDAENLGKVIAEAGYHLTTGGLGGIMLKAAEGFCKVKRRSSVIGILPMGKEEAPDALKQVSFGAKRLPTDLSGFDRAGHKTHIGPSSRNHVLMEHLRLCVCPEGPVALQRLNWRKCGTGSLRSPISITKNQLANCGSRRYRILVFTLWTHLTK